MENMTNEKVTPTAEPVSACCGAPLYAATIYLGPDGRPEHGGEPMPVQKCMACGENYATSTTEGKSAFVIDSDNRANWYLRKRFLAEQEIALLTAQHEARLRSLRGDLDRLKAFCDPMLEAYTREKLATGKAKSHKFTFGTASFRTVPSRWEVVNPVDALRTAKIVCPSAVIVSEKLDAAALLAHVEATAEVVPGVKRSEEHQSFSVKFGTEKNQAARHVENTSDE